MKQIVVVGGGLAGLGAATGLVDRGIPVILLEGSPRLGGQIETTRSEGYVTELGAEGFVARSEAVPQLAARAAIADRLVGQQVHRSYGYRDGALVGLAPGEAAAFLGFQVPATDLGKGIKTFAGGMGSLVDAVAAALGELATIRRATAVRSLEPGPAGVRLALSDGSSLLADGAVIATNARNAATLLTPSAGAAARALQEAPTLSSLTVSLAYPRAEVHHPLDATGFVVASESQVHGFRACTFTSSKFGDRAPQGVASLRVFYRPTPEDLDGLSDDAWTERAHTQLDQVLGVTSVPLHSWVSRWPRALPVFDPDHRARVAELESVLDDRLVLAGAAFHGSGIDAAVASGARAARSLVDRLGS